MRLRMKKECIYCGSALVPAWDHPHWAYCPTCEPSLATNSTHMTSLIQNDAYARAAAADRRGRPTIGGSTKERRGGRLQAPRPDVIQHPEATERE